MASFTEPVTAEMGAPPSFERESELLSFRMSGICPAYFRAHASMKPSGAAYPLQPASMASWKWYSGS
jgi:hypothetical protein